MYLLLTYDINTETETGKKRLTKVAKTCEKYGFRVQNSVFEINVDAANLLILTNELSSIINHSMDSIRLYKLGKSYRADVKIIGQRKLIEPSQDATFDL